MSASMLRAAKVARRVAAKMANRQVRRRFSGELPPAMNNEDCKRLGLPHQGGP